MNWKPEQIVLSRLLQELKGMNRVALGPGIPMLARPHLNVEVIDLSSAREALVTVDAIVLDAEEVSELGDLVLRDGADCSGIQSDRWLVATRQLQSDGGMKLVEKCRRPAQIEKKAGLVITDLAVVEISAVGFELKELAPGTSSDDVRKTVAASLHVADDIRTMEL
jgi:acyl CoA:acetate/3-ketoacid CoA transferase beta subunit